MTPLPSIHHYPYHYAAGIIDRFIDKHSRVMVFFARKLHYWPEDWREAMISMFMHNNRQWNIIREVMKDVEKWDMYSELQDLDLAEFKFYLSSVKIDATNKLLDEKKLNKGPFI